MKKIMSFGLFLLFALVLVSPAQFSLKLNGGMTWINGNDYNKGVAGYMDYLNNTYTGVSGEFEQLKGALNFQGELIFFFNPNMGIGLGGGYFGFNKSNLVTYTVVTLDEITYSPKFTVIPLFLNFHYMVRIAPRLNLDLFIGPSLYLTSLKWTDSDTWLLWDLSSTFESKGTAFGGQAGLGFDFEMAPGFSLIVDGSYRIAQVSEIGGPWTQKGTFLFFTIDNSEPDSFMWSYKWNSGGETYDMISIGPDLPAGTGISGAKKAILNLSGISASAGFKIRF